jgi:hypothetical protein
MEEDFLTLMHEIAAANPGRYELEPRTNAEIADITTLAIEAETNAVIAVTDKFIGWLHTRHCDANTTAERAEIVAIAGKFEALDIRHQRLIDRYMSELTLHERVTLATAAALKENNIDTLRGIIKTTSLPLLRNDQLRDEAAEILSRLTAHAPAKSLENSNIPDRPAQGGIPANVYAIN